MSVAWEEYGNYATDVFTREAVRVIEVSIYLSSDIHFHLTLIIFDLYCLPILIFFVVVLIMVLVLVMVTAIV